MTESQAAMAPDAENDRPTMPALAKGWRCKCPQCGEGRLLHSYLKVNSSCSSCGLDLSQARADDGPAYLTILLVGHIMAPMMHVVYFSWRPDPLIMFTIFTIGCLASSLYLLPRMKGIVIAYQWARRMHGFGKQDQSPAGKGQ